MWRRAASDADALEILRGIGVKLMSIDARLQRVVQLLEHEDGEEEDQS